MPLQAHAKEKVEQQKLLSDKDMATSLHSLCPPHTTEPLQLFCGLSLRARLHLDGKFGLQRNSLKVGALRQKNALQFSES
eukprot:285992-Amphidinium_carterae.1